MIDAEVERLRRLRGSALRLRAVARQLGAHKAALNDPLMNRGACAAWRVARTVSGRLRAHPFADFQKDPGFGVLLGNSLAAKTASLGASNRVQVLRVLERQIKRVSRQLDDARAMAWSEELSSMLARSQREMRSLAADVERATYGACEAYAQPTKLAQATKSAPVGHAQGDWPFIAL
jgi:hypothetical protein